MTTVCFLPTCVGADWHCLRKDKVLSSDTVLRPHTPVADQVKIERGRPGKLPHPDVTAMMTTFIKKCEVKCLALLDFSVVVFYE